MILYYGREMLTKKIILLLMSILITSCGYHLKKNILISKDMQPIYLDGDRKLSLLLSRKLSINNIEVTNFPNQASTIIKINRKKEMTRTLTLDESGLTNQYSLTAECFLTWKFKNHDEYIIMPTKLSARVIQLKDNSNILGQYSMREKLNQQLNIKIIEKAMYLINQD